MSLFGPRKEDPLLQNDPLAPSSEEEKSTESSSKDVSPENDANGEEASHREQEAEDLESPSSSTTGESQDSVFTPSRTQDDNEGRGFFQFGSRGDSRVIVRSAKEADEGRLNVINSAMDEGWRLDRVETFEEASTQGTAAEKAGNEERSQLKLAFIFRHPDRYPDR